jgi:hypothetical protein
MARHHGIPVRARVGFARYFIPNFHVDHEIVEWWDSSEHRWRLVDPELSERHIAGYRIGFDPFDASGASARRRGRARFCSAPSREASRVKPSSRRRR